MIELTPGDALCVCVKPILKGPFTPAASAEKLAGLVMPSEAMFLHITENKYLLLLDFPIYFFLYT